MRTRFFLPLEIVNYFKQQELRNDLLSHDAMAICSIADLLDVCEAYKKGNLEISREELHRSFEAFNVGPIKGGLIFVVDLDQANLSSALFERDNEVVIDLWEEAADKNISPKRSLRYLTLRITDDSVWWSEEVYWEMLEYHTTRDE
jgi:hypothetical protein